jgi:hypothetical protein
LQRGNSDKKPKRPGSRLHKKHDSNKKKVKFPLNSTDKHFYKATQLYTGGEGLKKKPKKRGLRFMTSKPSPISAALNNSGIKKSNTTVKSELTPEHVHNQTKRAFQPSRTQNKKRPPREQKNQLC